MSLEQASARRVSTARPVEEPKKANTLELHGETADDLYNTLRSHPDQAPAIEGILKGFLGPFFVGLSQGRFELEHFFKKFRPFYKLLG